jgi:hypothetical protein
MTWFVRVGPNGMAYGPFASEDAAKAWLADNGFNRDHEGATFKVYAAHDPSLYSAHTAMRTAAS